MTSSFHRNLSVVLPTYNSIAFLPTAVESILCQTHTDFELIVVNDGSTDATQAYLDEIAGSDPRLKVIKQENAGIVASLNHGITAANGEFIARMDADDIAHPARLAKQVAYLKAHPRIGVIGTQMRVFSQSNNKTKRSRYPTHPDKIAMAFAKGRNPVCHPSVVIRKQVLLDVGGYRSFFTAAQDYDLWLRLQDRTQIANLSEVLLDYRSHDNSTTVKQHLAQNNCRAIARYCADKRRQGHPDPLDEMGGVVDTAKIRNAETRNELDAILDTLPFYHDVLEDPVKLASATAEHQINVLKLLEKGYLGGGRKNIALFCERVFFAARQKGNKPLMRAALRLHKSCSTTRHLKFVMKENAIFL